MMKSVLFLVLIASFAVLFQNFGLLDDPSKVSLPRVTLRAIDGQNIAIEGGTPAGITVSRIGNDYTLPLNVNLELSGAAQIEKDYSLKGGSLTIRSSQVSVNLPAGVQSTNIWISALPDFNYEKREQVIFKLKPKSGYTIDGPSQQMATVKIQRDKIPPQTFLIIANPQRSFNDDEIIYIAKNYNYVVLEKMHAKGNYIERDFDAHKIKKKNPNIKLFAYIAMSVRFWYNEFGRDDNSPHFNDEWYLRDDLGRDLQYLGTDAAPAKNVNQRHLYVDLRNDDYRFWVRQTMARWRSQSKGSWSGIFFDNSSLLNENEEDRPMGLQNIFNYSTQGKYTAPDFPSKFSNENALSWNRGLMKMLDEAHRDPHDNPILTDNNQPFLVAFNGIANRDVSPQRNLNILYKSKTDIALNERFCFHATRDGSGHFQPKEEMEGEFQIMKKAAESGKIIWQLTKMKGWKAPKSPSDNDVQKLGRYCYGAFLMGYTPGFHLFKFGVSSYSNPDATDNSNPLFRWDEIYLNASEIKLPLGRPKAHYELIDNKIWSRKFENGVIYVNPDPVSYSVQLHRRATLMINGQRDQTFEANSNVEIKGRDALFFIYE